MLFSRMSARPTKVYSTAKLAYWLGRSSRPADLAIHPEYSPATLKDSVHSTAYTLCQNPCSFPSIQTVGGSQSLVQANPYTSFF